MPAKKQKSYKFSQLPPDALIQQLFRESSDNFISLDKDGNVVIDKDIHCRSIFVDGDSVYINGIKLVTPKFEDDGKYWQYSRTAKEVSLVTKASPVVEETQDIVGAMLTGNTETFITVSYEDSDGTIDFVVPVKDEDNMASDSAVHLPTQQSVKAYADTKLPLAGGTMTGTLTTAGRRKAVVIKTAGYIATATDEVIVCNSATAFTITLPAATGSGQCLEIKNINTGVITIDGDSSDTIDGSTTTALNQWDCLTLIDYTTNAWVIV